MPPPLLADRYRIDSLLGRGGMAEVWRGHDLRLDRPVAVKILNQGGLADPAAVERFHREAVTVARMAHPNIVSGYDFGGADDRPYLVMELVEGRTLDAVLADGPLPVPEATRIAGQVCAALDAAHSAGVVHRDIKPGNLLVTPDGTVKVLDFGIARLQSATQAALTRAATVVGTSHYMAPEQASGGAPDARADLYALGCVIYAMLTGAPPFEGENPMGVLYQHLHSAPIPVRERRPDVTATLDELVGGLLAKAPEDRPGSAAEVRTRLAALSSQPGHTSVMPTVTQSAAAAAGRGGPADGDEGFAGRAAVPPAAPGSDTDVHPQPEGGARSQRGWALPAAAGAVIGLIVLLLIALALMPDGERGPDAKPPGETAQSPSPSPTPSPTATDPAGRLAELREQLGKQINAGAVEGEDGRKLGELLDKIGEDIQKGKLADATKHLAEFRKKLGEFADKGEVTGAAQDALNRHADRLAQVLPPPEDGDEGDDDGKGKGKGRGKGKKDD